MMTSKKDMVKNKLFLLTITIFLIGFIAADCTSNQVDVNTASLTELELLNGIGPVKGQAIIDTRPYNTLDGLINVYGIGPVTLQKIKDQGLACIASTTPDPIPEVATEEPSNEEVIEKTLDDPIPNTIKQPAEETIPKNTETIVLATETFNNGESSKKLDKNSYAKYGLIVFPIILALLFLLKRKNYKNEFKK